MIVLFTIIAVAYKEIHNLIKSFIGADCIRLSFLLFDRFIISTGCASCMVFTKKCSTPCKSKPNSHYLLCNVYLNVFRCNNIEPTKLVVVIEFTYNLPLICAVEK